MTTLIEISLKVMLPILLIIFMSSAAASHPDNGGCHGCEFLDSLEDLLRDQASLLAKFEYLVHKTPTNNEEKVEFLASFEDLLRRQAVLFGGFEDALKLRWDFMSLDEQEKFLASFEDLLEKEVDLYFSFDKLFAKGWCGFTPEERVKFCRSFEDLLRRQADLFNSYEELFKMTYGGICIEKNVDKTCVMRDEYVTYTYQVMNWFDKPLYNVSIIDSNIGIISSGFSLNPKEFKIFSRSVKITGDTCNTAKVIADDGEGHISIAKSAMICVKVDDISYNLDHIATGNQRSLVSGDNPISATNKMLINKNQKTPSELEKDLINSEEILLGDQESIGYGNGESAASNLIQVNSNQR